MSRIRDIKQQERLNKLQDVVYSEGIKLIYEWVKTGQVTVKQFDELINENIKLEDT
jgi:hypothetical protein